MSKTQWWDQEPGRIYLGDGVAIKRRGRVWWLHVYREGKRIRKSLRTWHRKWALYKAVESLPEPLVGFTK